ncbi:stretch-activated Ca2+-permeable channel component-domain-containing protein [Lophiotrema nucula]|uniref:Stretch-activated Ca2+-permeable channel component-domain-containing protein n=1 Tax=Lophiotrema nucula TaxID=690887 RepID=A0A6A5ZHL7_9PLEO|nr:stretch-activated Ca2+-permeable channel component-domain-containing protein [Lophiotrema nucula]
MQLPKLTPLQSRLLASAIATCALILIWISFQPRYFVYAVEVPLGDPAEASPHDETITLPGDDVRILDAEDGLGDTHFGSGEREKTEARSEGTLEGGYAPDFAYFDRSLIGRATDGVDDLANGKMMSSDVDPGSTHYFRLPAPKRRRTIEVDSERASNASSTRTEEEEELRKRQQNPGATIYISVATCLQPEPNKTTGIVNDLPEQLTLYVSQSSKNTKPGPNAKNDLATDPISLQNGFANYTLQASSDIFLGVSAPNLTADWKGKYSFQVAASSDADYHGYSTLDNFLFMVDADSESALFITKDLTTGNTSNDTNSKWMETPSPFTLFTFTQTMWEWFGVEALSQSYCGLQAMYNATKGNATVEASMTDRYTGGTRLPKGQLHAERLNASQNYLGVLAFPGNASLDGLELPDNITIPRGGLVMKQFGFNTTDVDDSCQVIFGLGFCSDTAYAVPSSSKFKTNTTGLAQLYDQQAQQYFTNFSNSLDQVACDTTGTAQYSLARTCTDCRNDYKTWLCSVIMPRCRSWKETGDELIPRNINAQFSDGSIPFPSNMSLEFNQTMRQRFAYNQSRNPMIDQEIQPGPYKELLPCETLCFDIVRSCPAQLGFSCPNNHAMKLTYGKMPDDPNSRDLTCNKPGAVLNLSTLRGAAGRSGVSGSLMFVVATLIGFILWL